MKFKEEKAQLKKKVHRLKYNIQLHGVHAYGPDIYHEPVLIYCITFSQLMFRFTSGEKGLYRIAGNFRGVQFSRFSRLISEPRKLDPRNIHVYNTI